MKAPTRTLRNVVLCFAATAFAHGCDTPAQPDASANVDMLVGIVTDLRAIDAGVGAIPPASCLNHRVDGDETDVDCGGSCAPCGGGRRCNEDADCLGVVCLNHVCVPPSSCAGHCGGACEPCPVGDDCSSDQDCANPDGGVAVCIAQPSSSFPFICDGCESYLPPSSFNPGTCRVHCERPEDCPNTCCDSLSHSCGRLPGKMCANSNCGVAGQWCIYCRECGMSPSFCSPTGDYCARVCSFGGCTGCCGGFDQYRDVCLRGDDDAACGTAGSACVACPSGTHCSNGTCL